MSGTAAGKGAFHTTAGISDEDLSPAFMVGLAHKILASRWMSPISAARTVPLSASREVYNFGAGRGGRGREDFGAPSRNRCASAPG